MPRSVADPLTSHAANATGTLMVLDAARHSQQPPHVTFASSSSVCGANPELPKHEDLRCVPMSPYAVSKLATDSYTTARRDGGRGPRRSSLSSAHLRIVREETNLRSSELV